MASPYEGPYRVASRRPLDFKVHLPGRGVETIAISRLKPAFVSNSKDDDDPDLDEEVPPSPPRRGRRPGPPKNPPPPSDRVTRRSSRAPGGASVPEAPGSADDGPGPALFASAPEPANTNTTSGSPSTSASHSRCAHPRRHSPPALRRRAEAPPPPDTYRGDDFVRQTLADERPPETLPSVQSPPAAVPNPSVSGDGPACSDEGFRHSLFAFMDEDNYPAPAPRPLPSSPRLHPSGAIPKASRPALRSSTRLQEKDKRHHQVSFCDVVKMNPDREEPSARPDRLRCDPDVVSGVINAYMEPSASAAASAVSSVVSLPASAAGGAVGSSGIPSTSLPASPPWTLVQHRKGKRHWPVPPLSVAYTVPGLCPRTTAMG